MITRLPVIRGNYYQKLLEIEKEIVREVARGVKHYPRKSADRKAQISGANASLICALRSADFFQVVFFTLVNLMHNLFSIPNSFWYWYDSLFWWEEGR